MRVTVQLGDETFTGEDTADPTARELLAPVRVHSAQEWNARISFTLTGATGQPVATQSFGYPVFMDPPVSSKRPPLPIVPTPKEVWLSPGSFSVPRRIVIATASGPVDARVTNLLTRELKRWYGVDATIGKGDGRTALLLVKHEKGKPLPAQAGISRALASRLERLPAQGYVLIVSPARVVMAANDDAGLYYAAQTFLQTIELTTASPDTPRARCLTVVDWPTMRWRGLTLTLPTWRWGYPIDAPVDVGFFCDFIGRFIARHKVNALVFVTEHGVKYDSHPELSGPAAWSKEQMRRVVQTCRENFIEPIPCANSYGHAWMVAARKDLWEDGEGSIACTSNPDTFKILTDVYSELFEAFAPVRYFHIGMDEVMWQTLATPPEKQCKLCAGIPKWQLYADQVRRLDDWFRQRGVRTMMWSDMLVPEHNGGPPYDSTKALPLIPKDVLQCNWSFFIGTNSDRLLRDQGFTVWQSNSPAINSGQARYCQGNMFGVWCKVPWLAEGPDDGFYSYLNFPMLAEYSWNVCPDGKIVYPLLTEEWLRQHEEAVLTRDGLDPEPAASAKTFSIPVPANLSTRASLPASPEHWFNATPDADLRRLPRGTVTIEGIPFRISDAPLDCATPSPAGPLSIPVGRKSASLRFLHVAHLAPDKEDLFLKGFQKSTNWRGVPMGAYTITYEDGSTVVCPIVYINNIRRWEIGDGYHQLSYIFRSVGFLHAATDKMLARNPDGRDICLYVAQWVNPHPEKVIRSIEVTGCPEAVPVVFAITGRAV